MGRSGGTPDPASTVAGPSELAPSAAVVAIAPTPSVPAAAANALLAALAEQHFTIRYGDIGHSYDSIFGPYLSGAKEVVVEDPSNEGVAVDYLGPHRL